MPEEEYLDIFYNDQNNWCNFYIDKYCSNCKYHSLLLVGNRNFHFCNDDWSPVKAGNHMIYHETIEICAEVSQSQIES